MYNISNFYSFLNTAKNPARISPKENSGANGKFLPQPLLFHLRHPNSKTNEPKFWQILSPKNSFAKISSALFRHLPEYLEGRTPKRKMSFPFSEKIGRAQIRKARNIFSFWGCRVKRGGGGTIRAYDLVSSHHALRAWHIVSDFGNRFELGTINTPNRNTPAFPTPDGGRCEETPTPCLLQNHLVRLRCVYSTKSEPISKISNQWSASCVLRTPV